MKKFLFVIAAAFLFGAPAFAQTSIFDITPANEAKCTLITRAMALELRLNEHEYIKLKQLNRERIVKTNDLLHTYGDNATVLKEKMKELELAYAQKITSFLTPNQLHAYANYKEEATHVSFVAATSK